MGAPQKAQTLAPKRSQGSVAGRYVLRERIAHGASGEVWLAHELSTGRPLALKRLHQLSSRTEARFRAEYHTLAQLSHPYIIQVYEFGIDCGVPFYTMELLDGHDLRDSPHLSVEEAVATVLEVACGLSLLHAQRLLHRDISPRNVRRTHAGTCKLIDFGSMMGFGVAADTAGTPGFIAPEAGQGALLDQRADLYSLGALLYWLLTRRMPSPSQGAQADGAMPQAVALAQLRPDVPPELDTLVMSMLAFDPNQRPLSSAEVIARLSPVARQPVHESSVVVASHLESCAVVGRTAALAVAERALTRATVGRGGGLAVSGVAGVGKSRFLQEVSIIAQTRGYSVVRAFCARSSGGAQVARELYWGLRRSAPEVFEQLPERERAALESLDAEAPETEERPAGEGRAELQWALSRFFREVTATAPWLIVVDDLDQADEFSGAFIAALTTMAETLPLLVAFTFRRASAQSAAPSSRLCGASASIRLDELDQGSVAKLVLNLFGAVPGTRYLDDFLFREARGNPGLTFEIIGWLIDRGTIRYKDGAFVLPESAIRDELPARAGSTLSLRADSLTPEALSLAQTLSLCRGGAALDLCLAASSLPQESSLAALNELVARGVLMESGPVYVFRQEALRRHLRHSLSADQARFVHERLARAYLVVDQHGAVSQLEGALHLVHTEQALAGAERLRRIAPGLIDSGVAYQDAIMGLEQALEVFERSCHSLAAILDVRVALARAAYLYDYRLAHRYASRTIELLQDWCGLTFLARFKRFLPRGITLLGSLLIMSVRSLVRKPERRGPGPRMSIEYLARVVLSTLGVYVTALDGARARELAEVLGHLRGPLGKGPISTLHHVARAMSLMPLGRQAEQRRAIERALCELSRPWPHAAEAVRRQDLRVGLLLALGMNESHRRGGSALDVAAQLEGEGTRLSRAAAHRVRFTYYTVRGMREQAESHRRELDLCGIQGGTTWQVEWFAVPTEGMTAALLGDLAGTSRALSRLDALAEELPSMQPMRDMVRIGYHLRRGDLETANELGAAFVERHPPQSVVGWGPAYAVYAAALNEAGQPAAAAELCEWALGHLADADREHLTMYGPLSRERDIAWTKLGHFGRALEMADAEVARLMRTSEHALLCHTHAHRAALGKLAGDRGLVRDALDAMHRAAVESQSQSLVEHVARTSRALLEPSTTQHAGGLFTGQLGPTRDVAETV